MISPFPQAVDRGTFQIDFGQAADHKISEIDFDTEVVVRYTLSDERMRQARELNNTLAEVAGTFELLRCGPGGDVTIIPRNTLPGHDEFLQARYPRLQTITLEGFDLPIPAQPEDVDGLLEAFPTGFIRDPEYGLGLLKELNLVVSAIEEIDDVRHLVVSNNRASEIDRGCYILAYHEFNAVRRSLQRIHDSALRSARVDKHILVHNALLTTRLPNQFPEKHRPYKRDTIFKAVSGQNEAETLSPADRGAALAIVSKSKRELARTEGPALLKLRREIELVTLEQLVERIETLIGTKKPERVWQQLFLDNPFILTLAFGLPIVAFGGQASVGGGTFAGHGEKIGDFLHRNGLTLLEIKTPETKVLGSVYRDGVHAPSHDLVGTVNQVLDQRYQLQRSMAYKKDTSRVTNVELYAIKCVVVIGRVPADPDEKKSLELFRNNLNDVLVVTFNELLEKLRHLHTFLKEPPAPLSEC